MLLLSKNSRYVIYSEVDFRSVVRYDVDVTDSGIPATYSVVTVICDRGGLFSNTNFNQLIGGWDMSNVITISFLFQNSVFNQPLNNWDVSNVRNMDYMFYNSKYNHPLNEWDVSSVTNMYSMFKNSKYNCPLTNWKMQKAIFKYAMFQNAVIKEEYKPRRCRDVAIK